jgi:hypothetical protein
MQIAALTTSQARALTTAQIASLTTMQVAIGLTTNQIVALTTAQVAALVTNDIEALTTDQVDALTTGQIEALTSDQIAAFTTTQISYLHLGTPIVLDLTGAGINTQSISAGVMFDIKNIDQAIKTGWVGQGTGLLVMDINKDGIINNGSELFGDATVLANGKRAINGYQALSVLDSNEDGIISSTDANFSSINVWVNAYDLSQPEQLLTMTQLGITSLDLNAVTKIERNNGNLIGLHSSYTTTFGATHVMADVWFAIDDQVTTAQIITLTNTEIVALTTAQIAGLSANDVAVLTSAQITRLSAVDMTVLSASQIGALSTDQIAALSSSQIGALNADQMASLGADMIAKFSPQESQTLQAQVSSLTNALSLFNSLALETGNNTPDLVLTALSNSQGMAVNQAVAVNVNGLVAALKMFDANGILNMNQTSGTLQTASNTTPLIPNGQPPTTSGFLAS